MNKILLGDCRDVLASLPDESVDLAFTSPPYAERRKKTYGGVHEDEYADWFLPISLEIKRVLKSSGSFFLNLKPHTKKGERSLYVFDLICRLKREVGFFFVDEYCWTKNAFPGDLKGRFKNGFEPIYHFTRSHPSEIKFNPLACGTPIKEGSIARAHRKQCGAPKNGSGMVGMKTENIRNLSFVRPSNVINVNNVSNQFSGKQFHPGTFPERLVEFFVKSFTNEGDVVLDPFAGSGTVGLTCIKLKREFVMIEKNEQYFKLSQNRINAFFTTNNA